MKHEPLAGPENNVPASLFGPSRPVGGLEDQIRTFLINTVPGSSSGGWCRLGLRSAATNCTSAGFRRRQSMSQERLNCPSVSMQHRNYTPAVEQFQREKCSEICQHVGPLRRHLESRQFLIIRGPSSHWTLAKLELLSVLWVVSHCILCLTPAVIICCLKTMTRQKDA